MVKMKVADLVVDYEIYPRAEVNKQYIGYLREALRAGAIFPPIVIDVASKVITDGVNRRFCYLYELGADCSTEVIAKRYKSRADMLLDAVRMNAAHGLMTNTYDKVHTYLRAERLGIKPKELASAMNITAERLEGLCTSRIAKTRLATASGSNAQALKRTIQHKAGQCITKAQQEANDKLGGMPQVFYVNQLIMLLENDLIDKENENLIERLERLGKLIRGMN